VSKIQDRRASILSALLLTCTGFLACDFSITLSKKSPSDYANLKLEFSGSQLKSSGADTAEIRLSRILSDGSAREEIEPVILEVSNQNVDVFFENLSLGKKRIEIYLIDSSNSQFGKMSQQIVLKAGENDLSKNLSIKLFKKPSRRNSGNGNGNGTGNDGAGGDLDIDGKTSAQYRVAVALYKNDQPEEITYYDVSGWLEKDCLSCHSVEEHAGGIDLSKLPFLKNGEVPDVGSDLNQKVVDSLTGAYGVTLMPESENDKPVQRWSRERIDIMNAWSENEFAKSPAEVSGIVTSDYVGTVRLIVSVSREAQKRIIILAASSIEKSVYIGSVKEIAIGSTISGVIEIYDQDGNKISETKIAKRKIDKKAKILTTVKLEIN